MRIGSSQARLQPGDPQAYLALSGAERSPSLRAQVILTSQHLYTLGKAWSYIFLMCLSYTENHYLYFYGIAPFPNIPVSHFAHEGRSTAFKCTELLLFLSKVQNDTGGGDTGEETACLCLFYSLELDWQIIKLRIIRQDYLFTSETSHHKEPQRGRSHQAGTKEREGALKLNKQRSEVSAQVPTAVWLWD